MQKQRNTVDKSLLELSESIKTAVNQVLYSALADAKVDRQQTQKILATVIGTVDVVYGRSSKHFDKAVDSLITAVREDCLSKATKSKKAG